MPVDLDFFGTRRQVAQHGINVQLAPAGATHAGQWSHEGRLTVVWERRTGGGRYRVWDGAAWVNREAHYQAWRQISEKLAP